MKRTIDYFLLEWKNRYDRKSLLVRGARQIGKTHAIRTFGTSFDNFIEVNLETNQIARSIMQQDLDVHRIVLQLSELFQKKIEPDSTLLFFDEIQTVPLAITALRYFYEEMPQLHVVAAGSLLDFAIEEVGIPVGRVSSLYMYPLSFFEFLVALGHNQWAKAILNNDISFLHHAHEKILTLIGTYLAIGGMPAAVKAWAETRVSRNAKMIHSDLLDTYRQDFGKYARKHQIKYVSLLFQKTIEQLSNKFMYTRIGEYQKRELEPALELLEKAGLYHRVTRTSGQGIPLGAQAQLNYFKIIFCDVGLSQALLQLDISSWLVDPLRTFINKGEIIEAFVGQELLAYSDPISKEMLFYWCNQERGNHAEVDYVIQLNEKVVPIEVKAGSSKRIKSMRIFLDSHLNTSYGIRFSADFYSQTDNINTYPLYAIVWPQINTHQIMHYALSSLL